MESGDSEYEEEEMVVLAELNGLVDDELLKNGCTYQFVGIDTDKPVLQLGKYNFLGSYEDQMGSALFIKQSTDEDGHKSWSKQCFSDKKLSMQRVFLRKKGEELPLPSEAPGVVTAMDEDLADVPKADEGQERVKDQESEPGSSTAADETQREPATNVIVEPITASEAATADGSDVDMPLAEASETASSKTQIASDHPPADGES